MLGFRGSARALWSPKQVGPKQGQRHGPDPAFCNDVPFSLQKTDNSFHIYRYDHDSEDIYIRLHADSAESSEHGCQADRRHVVDDYDDDDDDDAKHRRRL